MAKTPYTPPKVKITAASFRRLLRIYAYVRPHRWWFAAGMVCLFLSSAASLVFPKLLGDLVDAARGADFITRINRIGLVLFAVLVLQAAFSYLRVVIFVRVTQKALAALRQAVYRHLICLPMAFFSRKRVGELNSRISSDISLLQDTFTTTLAEFLRQLIIVGGGLALLLVMSPRLTLFMLAVLPAVMVIAVFFGRFIRGYAKKVQQQIAESNTIVEETLQGVFSVKAFTNEAFEFLRYRRKTDEVAKTAIRGGRYRGAFSSFMILGLFGAMSAMIWKGCLLIASGDMQTGQLVSFVIYSGFIGGSIGGLADVYARIQRTIGATEDLLEILEEPVEPVSLEAAETPAPPSAPATASGLTGALAFDNVYFSYPSRPDLEVLHGISFSVRAGEQLALVGPSGAGKSTIASLILQMYRPTKGSLLFDGRPAATYPLTTLRAHMAVVPQDVFLFGGSIRENIAYGRPGAGEAAIREAARQANADEFIERFPAGYDTVVGERGIQLSGGQRQRIAIARAILHDPRILILDEATSSLDSASERLVQDALERLLRGRTSVVIAHRLSTIRRADRILVLREGRVAEEGAHEELLAREGGLYRMLSELQLPG